MAIQSPNSKSLLDKWQQSKAAMVRNEAMQYLTNHPPRPLPPRLLFAEAPPGDESVTVSNELTVRSIPINRICDLTISTVNLMTPEENNYLLPSGKHPPTGIPPDLIDLLTRRLWSKVFDDIFDRHTYSIAYEGGTYKAACSFEDALVKLKDMGRGVHARLRRCFAYTSDLTELVCDKLEGSEYVYQLGLPTADRDVPMIVIAHKPIWMYMIINQRTFEPEISYGVKYGVHIEPGVAILRTRYVDV